MSKVTKESKTDHPGVCVGKKTKQNKKPRAVDVGLLKDGWGFRDPVEEGAQELPGSHDQSPLQIV